MKLYSKEHPAGLISSMIARDRLCRSFILIGDKGIGKKTFAGYMSMQALCERATGVPCGKCRSCRLIEQNIHPDVITVKTSGKSANYRVDDLRPIISDAYIASNEGGYKIYILPEIDKALPAAQNILLKIFEEPPEHVLFIMTAERKEKILETILSRAVVINITETSEQDCLAALKDNGIAPDDAARAYDIYGGNIGACLAYLSGEGIEAVRAAEAAVNAIIGGDEYSLCKALFISDRELGLQVVAELSRAVCAAASMKQGGPETKYLHSMTRGLMESIRLSGLIGMYEDLKQAADKLSGNSNVLLTMCDLGASLRTDSI